MKDAKLVQYEGDGWKAPALVVGQEENGNLNLIVFARGANGGVQHANDVPKGEGGVTWSALD